jgi:hypothetical protein
MARDLIDTLPDNSMLSLAGGRAWMVLVEPSPSVTVLYSHHRECRTSKGLGALLSSKRMCMLVPILKKTGVLDGGGRLKSEAIEAAKC